MSLATVCWTVFCTMLLSLADAAPMSKMDGRALGEMAESGWPILLLDVEKQLSSGQTLRYTAYAVPVFSLFDYSVTYYVDIDLKGRRDPTLTFLRYTQANGFAVMFFDRTSNNKKCLDTETGNFDILPIHAITKGLMNAVPRPLFNNCTDALTTKVGVVDYKVCLYRGENGYVMSGSDTKIKVTFIPPYAYNITSNGGYEDGCKVVVQPYPIQDSVGRHKLLSGMS